MTLSEASCNLGKRVIYKPYKKCNSELYEYGKITSVVGRNVFVLYDGEFNSKATSPEDIEFI